MTSAEETKMSNKKRRLHHFGHVMLSPMETGFNWLVWMPLNLLPFYLAYKLSVKWRKEFVYYQELTPGWLGYEKDSNDYEWLFWHSYAGYFLLLFLSNSVVVFLAKQLCPKYLKEVMILTALALHSFVLSWKGVAIILCQIVCFHSVTLLRSKLCMWLCAALMIIGVNNEGAKMFINNLVALDDESYQMTVLSFMMSILRLVSYGCFVIDQKHKEGEQHGDQHSKREQNGERLHGGDKHWEGHRGGEQNSEHRHREDENGVTHRGGRQNIASHRGVEQHSDHQRKGEYHGIIDCLNFTLYVPVFYNGPVITYDIFTRDMGKQDSSVTSLNQDNKQNEKVVYGHVSKVTRTTTTAITALAEKLPEIFKDSLKCVVHYVCFEVFLHFIHVNALARNHWMLEEMSALDVVAISWVYLHIFNIKYYIFYRFAGLFAKLDGIVPPGPPKCIASLYTFVDMWRYFDKGLYRLLQQCIYFPLGGSKAGLLRQVFASFLCFSFVGFWHGGSKSLMFWALSNWLGIVAEAVVTRVTLSTGTLKQRIGSPMHRRLCAVGGSLSVFALIYTNMVFLVGYDSATTLLGRVFVSWYPSLLILLVLYFTNQCSIDVN